MIWFVDKAKICFISAGMIYTTRYCLKVNADPGKSLVGEEGLLREEPNQESREGELAKGGFPLRGVLAVAAVLAGYIMYGVGARQWGWGWKYLTSMILLASALIAIIYRWTPNQFARTLYAGAMKMGGICLAIGLVANVSNILTDGNVIHTIYCQCL